MKFTESLKKNHEFKKVYRHGSSVANRLLVMYILKNNTDKNKLGLSVSKKVGKSVVRSRVTRLIKESYRLMEPLVMPGYDIIFIARINTAASSFSEINGALRHLLKKQGVLRLGNNKEN